MTAAPPEASIRICGIGASAGGVDALQQFFAAVPVDLGLAYVVIIHLAPDFKSELPAILGRVTAMPVIQVGDHHSETLQADHVYVIAPDRKLEITGATISASDFDQPRGRRAAIDLFFRSLAAGHGDGFAVILSGGGSDGAIGARAVKERGGLVLVQDPDEAEHSSMPRAVVASGVADLVLPIRELVAQLGELTRSKDHVRDLVRAEEVPYELPVDESRALMAVLELVQKRTGHDFAHYKRATVLRRMSRRMQLVQQPSIAAYSRYLRGHPDEARLLFEDLLISVTTFFRDPGAWAALAERVIGPLIEAGAPGDHIRVWVAGCATGEEAYAMAMLFDEELARRETTRNVVVFASDVDEAALAAAREGLYPQAIAADVPEARLERYFRAEDSHYRVAREMRDRVVFASHSILRDPPFSRLNLVSCRNVLIYFDRELQDQVMSVFRYALRDGGHLFLGSSENADDEMFRAIDGKHRIFTTRPGMSGLRSSLPDAMVAPGAARPGQPSGRPADSRLTPAEIHLAALEDLSPPSVVVDERGNVMHVSAGASRYFRQGAGPPARRITELVRIELRDEAATLLHHVAAGEASQLSSFVAMPFDGVTRRVAMTAQRRDRQGRTDLLLTFLDGGEVTAKPVTGTDAAAEPVRELREKLRMAEQRVDSLRDEHFLTNEELRAANEELQSLNEEYRSTTEELETSKEELQSVNEELQTVNHELKLKLDEVSQAHSDVENLMAATNVATLFLNRELRIKRYTPQLEQIFNIRARDFERPIGDLTHTLDYAALESDAASVLQHGVAVTREAASRDGRGYVVRLSPYRSSSQTTEGVVLTFIDVTEFKRVEHALRESERRLESELNVMRRLHTMAVQVAMSPTMDDALGHLLTAAMDLHGAQLGSVQLLDQGSQRLELIAQRGFGVPYLDHFTSLADSDPSVCGRAFQEHRTVQIADIHLDPAYAAMRAPAVQAGYRAVQSTPLLNRAGRCVGVLSVYFQDSHAFTERDSQLAALLGRQAAELIEARLQQLDASASKMTTSAVRQLLARLVQVQEDERRRIARDLHDEMGQQMTALRMNLDALSRGSLPTPELHELVMRTSRLADELDHSIDFLTWELRPAGLEQVALPEALADLVRKLVRTLWRERRV